MRYHEERQAWETRRQRQLRAAQNRGHEGRQAWETRHGSGSQEQPRMEIMKGDKLGRQGGSQEQPRNGDHKGRQMKGDKAAAAAKSSPEWRSWRGDKWRGRQGGSGITTIWRFWGSATQSLRSKNPYSFQLSGEKTNFVWSHHFDETAPFSRTSATEPHIKIPFARGQWGTICDSPTNPQSARDMVFGRVCAVNV